MTSLSGSSLLCWFSLVVGSRGCLFSSCDAGFSLCWLLLLWSTGPMVMAHGLNCSTACEIFLTQGLNSGLLHCRWVLYHLSHQGCPKMPLGGCLKTFLGSLNLIKKTHLGKMCILFFFMKFRTLTNSPGAIHGFPI